MADFDEYDLPTSDIEQSAKRTKPTEPTEAAEHAEELYEPSHVQLLEIDERIFDRTGNPENGIRKIPVPKKYTL
jgi:hypothetical protein